MRKQILFFLLFFVQLFTTAQSAKIVGYLPSYRFGLNSSIEYCKITHLNICFANPDLTGNLIIEDFSTITTRARQQNPDIKICISLAGGAISGTQMNNWSTFIDVASNRSAFISKIIDFVEINQLDGVDFDLEWDAVTSGYSAFVIQLSDSLKNKNLLFTAALPAVYRYPNISNTALAKFDFINIMAYDETGTWSPNQPGQHSSLDFAKRAVNFWKNQGVSSERLTLGVPFYGYNFDNQNQVFAFTYSTMVDLDILNADLDQIGKAYYNGRPTIEKKVEYAAENTSGIMIWELGQDKFDEYSLLNTIQNKFTSLGISTTGLCGNTVSAINFSEKEIKIYPNPGNKIINIEENDENILNVLLYNMMGQELNLSTKKQFNKVELNVSELKEGIYIIKVICTNSIYSEKIIIKHN